MRACQVSLAVLCLCAGSAAFAQQPLVSASAPVSLGISLQDGVFMLDAQVSETSTIRVFCPVTPGLVSFTGLTAQVETAFDPKTQTLQLSLPPGHYQVQVRAF